MMDNIITTLSYTFKEHVRHRIYMTLSLFMLLLLATALLASTVAGEARVKIVVDIGLAGIEVLALIAIVFVSITLILEEIESRSIYLVMTRPVEPWEYVLGRYLGTVGAVASGMAIMAVLHVLLLLCFGWGWEWGYAAAWLCSMGKICVVGALALLLSLLTTSSAVAMEFTVFCWLLGHLSREIHAAAQLSESHLYRAAAWVFANAVPNLSVYNYRDFLHVAIGPSPAFLAWMSLYTAGYAGVCLYVACVLLSEKEF